MELLELLQTHSVKTVHDTLGIKVEELDPKRVVLSMAVTEHVHQFTRIMHGGVSVVLAESAASIGAALNTDLSQFIPVGVEINANHLRSVSRGTIMAIATPVHTGSKLVVWQVEIRDHRQRLVCISRCTLMLKPGNSIRLARGEI